MVKPQGGTKTQAMQSLYPDWLKLVPRVFVCMLGMSTFVQSEPLRNRVGSDGWMMMMIIIIMHNNDNNSAIILLFLYY